MNHRRRSLRVRSSTRLPSLAAQVGRIESLEHRTLLSGAGSPDEIPSSFALDTTTDLSGGRTVTANYSRIPVNHPTALSVGTFPTSVVLSDLNGDGHPDIVTANAFSNDVSVLLGHGDGTFVAQVRFAVGELPTSVAVADLNGDGRPDIVTANGSSGDVSVLLGHGDGTFADPTHFAVGELPTSVAVADLDGDGRPDIVTANGSSGDVSVLFGKGDGTFAPQARFAAGDFPTSVAVGDLNGDGRPDLVTANGYTDDVSVLLGNGDGTFADPTPFAAGSTPNSVAVGDLNGDDRPDLVTANGYSDDVSVLLGHGDGTFADPTPFAAGSTPNSVAVADLDGDGRPDLVTANGSSDDVSVLLGNGDGTFAAEARLFVGELPTSVAVGDLNADGRPDLVTANNESNDVTVLLDLFDAPPEALLIDLPVGGTSTASGLLVQPGDFALFRIDPTINGRLTLQVHAPGLPLRLSLTDDRGNTLVQGDGLTPTDLDARIVQHVIRGTYFLKVEARGGGAGAFALTSSLVEASLPDLEAPAGNSPGSVAVGDLNGDGRPDLVTTHVDSDEVAVLLGNGDGTFHEKARLAVGDFPNSVAVGDLNNDGRPDIVTANGSSDDVSVLLGNGDGTFMAQARFAVGDSPEWVAVGDLNGDGRPDIVTANGKSADVSVLLGRGDGTFAAQARLAVGAFPTSVIVADFDGDGRPDLVTSNTSSGDVSVLLGRGDGTFAAQARFAVVGGPRWVAVGDLNRDGRPDLVTANGSSADVSVLLGHGDGTFAEEVRFATGALTTSVAVGDFDGDGRLDLVTSNASSGDVSVLLGRGDGTFMAQGRFAAGITPNSVAVADLNSDDRPDLVATNGSSAGVWVLLGKGNGVFVAAGTIAVRRRNTPLVADMDGARSRDVLTLDRAGHVLWREGHGQAPGTFAPPIIVNANSPARAFVVVETEAGPRIVLVDALSDSISLYERRGPGDLREAPFVRVGTAIGPLPAGAAVGSLATGSLPARIVSGDIDGDGNPDLAVLNLGDGSISPFLGDGRGGFRAMAPIVVGLGISDLTLRDTRGTGRLDLLLTSQVGGDARVLLNQGGAHFADPLRYHAGLGPYGLERIDGTTRLVSRERTDGVVVGQFTLGGSPSLVTANRRSNTLGLLAGLGDGFASVVTLSVEDEPRAVVATDLDGDGLDDLAILTLRGVTVTKSDGRGGFGLPFTFDAGLDPTGLGIADANADGLADLLVGNEFGDVLILLGKGDGTFRPFLRAEQRVALAVADLDGDGKDDFVFANEGTDSVTVDYGATSAVVGDWGRGVLTPGAVSLADMNGDGLADLVVANSGSNNILVYPGIGGGRFGPASNGGKGFAAGTNPTGFSLADLNGDTLPDVVVANTGSNDVSVLLSQNSGAAWTLVPGPRLKAGTGPVSTALQDTNDDRVLDLVVTNSGSDDVHVLPGIGGGFFNDTSPRVLRVGSAPVESVVGDVDGDGRPDLVTINSGSSTLTFYSGLGAPNPLPQTIGSGGLRPTVGLAGDFNGDGRIDLVVGHGGDGRLALFLGGPFLTLTASLTSASVPNPSGLAFDELSEGSLFFYASSEGRDAAVRLSFELQIGPSEPGAPGPGAPGGPTPEDILGPGPTTPGAEAPVAPTLVQVAQLLPLGGSTLALVATLVTIAIGTEAAGEAEEGVPSDVATTLVLLVTGSVLPTQAQAGSDDDAEDGSDGEASEPEPEEEELESSATALSEALQVVFGLEEAWQEARREARALILGEPGPAGPSERAAAVDAALERWSPWFDLLAPTTSATLHLAAWAMAAAMETLEVADLAGEDGASPSAAGSVADEDRVEVDPPPDADGQATVAVAMAAMIAADRARRRRRRNRTSADGRHPDADRHPKAHRFACRG